MTDSDAYPLQLDATPDERATDGYGFDYLRSAGYLDDSTTDTVAYSPERDVEYVFSVEGSVRIAYFEFPMEGVPSDTPKKITQKLKRRTRLQYFWFFDPETQRVQVFRASRGNFQFIYNPGVHSGTTAESKLDKLEQITEDINALFDYSDIVDRFYRELWDHRSDLASSLTTRSGRSLTEQDELLAAQRIIDRLVFLYFLVEKGVVVPVNDSNEMVRVGDANEIFDTLVEENDDFWRLLHTVFFERLTSERNDDVEFTGSYRLRVPYLNGSIFQSADRRTVEGDTVEEAEELVVKDFDWEALIGELNEYNWLLDGLEGDDEDEAGTVGNLTPAVLGHIYEKFVISVSKVGDDIRLSDLDASERNELLSEGNSEVGAYYTGEDITDFKARRALWEGLLQKIDTDLAAGRTPDELDPDDLYRPGTDQHGDVEGDQKDGFDVLYERYSDRQGVLDYIDSKLRELTVCDPAVGSGSFALAVANTLFEWRSMCVPDTDEYVLRREIIARNIFGVDVLEGATEICKLRLWLWLISATPVETTDGMNVDAREEIPPLPDITFNIRSGNSLLGFTELSAATGGQFTLNATTMEERLTEYGNDVQEFRESDSDEATKRELETRHDELKGDLDEWYAEAQSDAENNRLTVADHVDDVDSAWRSLDASPKSSTTLSVKVPDGIPESVETYLDDLGFTTYKYKARLDSPNLDKQGVSDVFSRLEGSFAQNDEWDVLVEREYADVDFESENLDACHWPLEFPQVFLENGGFDVVISNPPYGASISPEEDPLLKNQTNYECQGTNDSCEWFYERALDLVHDEGVVSYIVNKSIAFYSSWSDIRGKLLEETELKHVFDVGLGFVGVNLETIAMVHTLGGDGGESAPTVHRSRDLRRTTSNQPVHLGWADQHFMLDSETIIFRPISDEQMDVLDRLLANERRLGDVMSTDDTTRQLYIPDSKKKQLDDGDDHYINKNPWVQEFYLEDIWHRDLSDYRDSVTEYAVPRVMLKVLRGTRLRAWLDADGEVVGTEKLVNVPLEESTHREIAFVYAALNHPCASYYLQKAIFSETTESARVMDGQYSRPIPIPDVSSEMEETVAYLAWTLTLAKQLDHDSDRDLGDRIDRLQTALDAVVGGLYLDLHRERIRDWGDRLPTDHRSTEQVQRLFGDFYTERFATRDGTPEDHWDDIESVVETTATSVADWETETISDSAEMAVVEDIL